MSLERDLFLRRVPALCLVLWLAVGVTRAEADIPSFFRDLYRENEGRYVKMRGEEYAGFCRSLSLAPADSSNRRIFHETRFYHELLTGSGAVDCAGKGVLGIPYFWHWVDPNPRDSIVLLPDSIALSTVAPPASFAKYKSFAAIDRTPALFLSDLVSESPRYRHDDCGEFFTFGWCSEREMAFLALMTCLGYEGRIRQEGIHSWSELWCQLTADGGTPVPVIAAIDNTYGSLEWNRAPLGASSRQWKEDAGGSKELRWYNATARSARQHAELRGAAVTRVAGERIRARVRDWLEGDPAGGRNGLD